MNKMKNMKMVLLLISMALTPMLAFSDQGSSNGLINKHDTGNFFYKKGYRDGLRAGKRKGYNHAKRDMERNILKWKKKIKAMEAGKYLSKKNKITAPQIYQVNDHGSIKIVVKGCQIKRELTPKEILMLPDYGKGSIPETYVYDVEKMPGVVGNTAMSSEVSNSVYLPGIDNKEARPSLSGSRRGSVYKIFPDTEYYRTTFRKLNYPFAIVSGNNIKVRFKSSREAAAFAKNYRMSVGMDMK